MGPFCFGYPTSLAPDITGVWTADPDLTTLTGLLLEFCKNKLKGYQRLALIAHSMGLRLDREEAAGFD